MVAAKHRKHCTELVFFLEGVALFVSAGFDLAYAWDQTVDKLAFGPSFAMSGSSFLGRLRRFSEQWPVLEHRQWFSLIELLYCDGAPVARSLNRIAQQIRRQNIREMERFSQRLPGRLNLVLLVFYLPAALLLLLGPIVGLLVGAASGTVPP